MSALSILLWPFSFLYRMVLETRHLAFNRGWLSSKKAPIPTIVIGNLSLGGTGKTPVAAMILDYLSRKYRVALLSRGYGRTSKGVRWVEMEDDADASGDEPLLIKNRFPSIPVVVAEDRLKGAQELMSSQTEWLVLDDAFQHRKLIPDISILLVDYNKPFFQDHVLPAGTLRDTPNRWKTADMVFITKVPEGVDETQLRHWLSKFPDLASKPVFFFGLQYAHPVGVFTGNALNFNPDSVMAVCGIAKPDYFFRYLKTKYSLKKTKTYPDHHRFRPEDMSFLQKEFSTFGEGENAIFTTEKDAMRWRNWKAWKELPVFYIPIRFVAIGEKGKSWQETLDGLMKKHKSSERKSK